MTRFFKSSGALMLWWLCYLPLNAFIGYVFLRLVCSARPAASKSPQPPDDDNAMIKSWAETHLLGRRVVDDDEGFGTRFERHMMAKLLLGTVRRYGLRSVLESPADGVTGVPGANSLPLAAEVLEPVALTNPSGLLLSFARETWSRRGLQDRVTTFEAPLGRLPFGPGAYDLVWSFCMLERLNDPAAYLREITRVSGRMVLMVTLNRRNHGTGLHRLYHRALGKDWDHGAANLMMLSGVVNEMEKAGLQVVATGAVDVPPTWDTWDMPLGGEISRIVGLFGKRWEWKAGEQAVPQKGRLLSLFEWIEDNLPEWFKLRNAHHLYVLARPVSTEG